MHRMGNVTKRVQNQVIQSLKERSGRIWQLAEVGEISAPAKAKTEHLEIPMAQRNWDEGHTHQFEWAVDNIQCDARHGAERRSIVEHVRECSAEHMKCFFGA